ncbi:MAG: ABC transporter permease subunit [Kiritimatiellia bacterium]
MTRWTMSLNEGAGEAGKRVSWRTGSPGGAPSFAGLDPADMIYYQIPFPSAPGVGGHLLGTDDSGRDVLARLFYGFRIVIVASLIFLVFVYTIGISIGCAMGYFGGWFDLLVSRFIEILVEIPFLYMVIILSSIFSPNLFLLLLIMICFSWMGMTFFMRTATYREKARDYVAAAKLIGASTPRILFRHVLPNTLSMIVTFRALHGGRGHHQPDRPRLPRLRPPPPNPRGADAARRHAELKPWIFGSVFTAMVTVLVLITFVGEPVREAFDPRKFTVYK